MLFIFPTVLERGLRSGSVALTAIGLTRVKSTSTRALGITSRTRCLIIPLRGAFTTQANPRQAHSTRPKEQTATLCYITMKHVETLIRARPPLEAELATKGEEFTLWNGRLTSSRSVLPNHGC